MATSRLADGNRWVATVELFSGRPNPEWEPAAEAGDALAEMFRELPVFHGEPPVAPPLGYRGAAVTAPDGRRYEAYGGVVTRRASDGVDTRLDRERRFEAAVIDSSPDGALPEGLVGR